jgi:hypothetical protein
MREGGKKARELDEEGEKPSRCMGFCVGASETFAMRGTSIRSSGRSAADVLILSLPGEK